MKKNKTNNVRQQLIGKMSKTDYDLIVIGGGVTGAGIALDAAARGIKVALVEKGDYASGTSSKSTKLIHGGLRYLKQLEIGLVKESGTERAVVHQLAPHLCLPEKMLLPLVPNGTLGKWSTSLALKVYDFLAGVEKEDQREMLSPEEVMELEPLLHGKELVGGGYYAEYRTDDARLTIELVKKARALGADVINYMEAIKFRYNDDKRISGIKCRDHITREKIKLSGSITVSAAGPWVDYLRKKNNSIGDKQLFLSKGVHLVFPKKRFPVTQSIYFDVPDGRMVFAIPRGQVTYLGTTDTPYHGEKDRIVATEADRDYLLKAANHMFPSLTLTRYDVISSWAGVRPLIHEAGKSSSEISRKDEIFRAKDGLISIAGGKLTGYRKMSERVVDRVMKRLCKHYDYDHVESSTKTISLTDQPFSSYVEVELLIEKLAKEYYGRLSIETVRYLVYNFGNATSTILSDLVTTDDLSLALAELKYCLEHEQVARVDDFIVRRTGRLYFDPLSVPHIVEPIIDHMQSYFDWDDDRVEQEHTRMQLLIQDSKTFYEDEQQPTDQLT